jgi:hypothetical protein
MYPKPASSDAEGEPAMPVIESFDVIGSGQAGGPLATACARQWRKPALIERTHVGGELMAIFEVAMLGRLPYTVLRDAVVAHPTLAESLNNLFATLDDGTAATAQDVENEIQSMQAASASLSAAEAQR